MLLVVFSALLVSSAFLHPVDIGNIVCGPTELNLSCDIYAPIRRRVLAVLAHNVKNP